MRFTATWNRPLTNTQRKAWVRYRPITRLTCARADALAIKVAQRMRAAELGRTGGFDVENDHCNRCINVQFAGNAT